MSYMVGRTNKKIIEEPTLLLSIGTYSINKTGTGIPVVLVDLLDIESPRIQHFPLLHPYRCAEKRPDLLLSSRLLDFPKSMSPSHLNYIILKR